jgi:hypothetical protein
MCTVSHTSKRQLFAGMQKKEEAVTIKTESGISSVNTLVTKGHEPQFVMTFFKL